MLEPEVLDFIDGDLISWEADSLPLIASKHQLAAFKHEGFWQAMDTLRDKNCLEDLWKSGKAPWKMWS